MCLVLQLTCTGLAQHVDSIVDVTWVGLLAEEMQKGRVEMQALLHSIAAH